ncbi:MAG: nucleotidyl transferase AbiEii/AbiGii toxin family protein [Halioglobus sp.]|nr:nucleotidyl transferase AbiEii/AbiGii toxin family protein [Calditrichota bacterium]MCB1678979.1 nucleotidyl transferase AbiEii/AbiGii toxin family protein [Halioglobus sp.]
MPFDDKFRGQVALLVSILPLVAEEECFALKGGTAINLFVRDLPRLSVDIDLTYLPVAGRAESLAAIDAALGRISERVRKVYPDLTVQASAPGGQGPANKLVIRTKHLVQIKVEVTPVLRGCVYEPELMAVSGTTEDEFGFAQMMVLSFADLYAGKIMAALDRQHPRDLFDVHLLLAHEGITDELRTALVVYLVSHDHSPQSLLAPQAKDIRSVFETDFAGMTEEPVALETLIATRDRLTQEFVSGMPEAHKEFLLSFYRGEPAWDRLGCVFLRS